MAKRVRHPRIGPTRCPMELWYLETKTPGGGIFRRYFGSRTEARQALKAARFEAHRAKDPHCTCNDCVAAHAGEEEPSTGYKPEAAVLYDGTPGSGSLTRRGSDTEAAARAAADRLLTRHGGSLEDAVAEARRYQLRYSPGTTSWHHYTLVLAHIEGGPRAK